MVQNNENGQNSWRWVQISAVLLLIAIALGIVTISAGAFDPKPIGDLQYRSVLAPQSVNAKSSFTQWLEEPTISGSGTIRLLAAYNQGEIDSSYGIVVGEVQDQVVVGISPAGYLTIQRQSDRNGQNIDVDQILPWQPWPHIRKLNSDNEIWIDFEQGFITSIRINRELLWQENIPFNGDQIGLVAQSFGAEADFNFISIQLYLGEE